MARKVDFQQMQIRRGIAVSPGIAIGTAIVLCPEHVHLPHRKVAAAHRPAELQRLRQALEDAVAEIREQQEAVSDKLGRHYGSIFGAHVLMLEDPELFTKCEALIQNEGLAAENAFARIIREYTRDLESLKRGIFPTRVADLRDIEKHVMQHLLGRKVTQLQMSEEPVIVLAHDLSPSETASLDTAQVQAFATEVGGRTSHTAILANALHLPAIVGTGSFLYDIEEGDTVIVDGHKGLLVLNPDEVKLEEYRKAQSSYRSLEHVLEELWNLPAVTKDGASVTLLGNIEFPDESRECVERGADGVGLYRTEFLYLGHTTDPTEEEHLAAYVKVLQQIGNKPVVIRTLDLGADKFASVARLGHQERNPVLGCKSIRYCLNNLDLFKKQMRAILRASAFGEVRIMFPMISTLTELRRCKEILQEVREDLTREGIAHDPDTAIGTMIEVPSAALMADVLAQEVDFFSIGTNDLVQYTLAADRTNEAVANLYTAGDPAVLRLIKTVFEAGSQNNVAVNVCGEMSGDPLYVPLLLGLGLRQLSLTPHNIPEIKNIIRSVSIEQAEEIARTATSKETAQEVHRYLREQDRLLRPRHPRA